MGGRNDERTGLLEDGDDPGYGGTERVDLALKTYHLNIFQESSSAAAGSGPSNTATDIPVPPGPSSFDMDALDYIEHALNERIPPICAMGMQRMESRLIDAAIEHAADIVDAGEHPTSLLASLKGETKLQRVWDKKQLAKTIRNQWDEYYPLPVGSPVKTAIRLSSMWFALVGFNVGIMNVGERIIFPDYSLVSWTWAVTAFPVGGWIGSILGMPVANRQGRKPGMMIMTILFFAGGICQSIAPGIAMIQTTRILLGIGAGMATTIVPIYLGEVVPPYMRGQVGGMLRRSVAMGILTSFVLPFLFEEGNWRLWVSLNSILSVVPILQIYNLVESPRWVLQREPDSRSARRDLKRIRLAESIQEMEVEAVSLARSARSEEPAAEHRNHVFACCLLQASQQFSGVYAILYYSNWMLSDYTAFENIATLMVGFTYVLATAFATRSSILMSNLSRRYKVLASAFAMMVCMIVLRVTWGDYSTAIMVALLAAYVGFYAFGLNSLPDLMVAELLDVSEVTRANSLSQQSNWVAHAMVAFAFPFLWKSIGRFTFECIICVLVVSTGGTIQMVPQLPAKTTKQYYTLLKKQHPVASIHARKVNKP